MTDAITHRLERLIREETAFRADTDPPDPDTHAHLMAMLDAQRSRIPPDAALRLEVLIERRTGVGAARWTGRD